MRALKWMTVFASLALFSLAVQAQGQSGRVDITGDAALDIWKQTRSATLPVRHTPTTTAGGSHTFQPLGTESSFVFIIE